jgi:hypothetical protein
MRPLPTEEYGDGAAANGGYRPFSAAIDAGKCSHIPSLKKHIVDEYTPPSIGSKTHTIVLYRHYFCYILMSKVSGTTNDAAKQTLN